MLLKWLPRTSAVYRAKFGEEVISWGVAEHLLAGIFDALAIGNYQRAGRKNAKKPKPIRRPGPNEHERTFGRDPIPMSRFKDWWDKKG